MKHIGRMRYFIRSADGRELVCPTLADLHSLYQQGFLGDDDLVRPENSDRWVRAGVMPALHGAREQRRDPRKVMALLAAIAVVVMGLAILLRFGR